MVKCHCHSKYDASHVLRNGSSQVRFIRRPCLSYPVQMLPISASSQQHHARCTAHTGRCFYLKAQPIRGPWSDVLVWGIKQCTSISYSCGNDCDALNLRWPFVRLHSYPAIDIQCECSPSACLFVFALSIDACSHTHNAAFPLLLKGLKSIEQTTSKRVQRVGFECRGRLICLATIFVLLPLAPDPFHRLRQIRPCYDEATALTRRSQLQSRNYGRHR
ncbi:hypothetical protein V8C34DRAFT_275251 [Trichoderma compactum]